MFVCSLVVDEINASSSLEIVEGQRFIAVSRNSCSNDCPREFDYLFDKCSIASFILSLPKSQLTSFFGGCDVPFSGSNLPKVWGHLNKISTRCSTQRLVESDDVAEILSRLAAISSREKALERLG